jgi:hypothetical protein
LSSLAQNGCHLIQNGCRPTSSSTSALKIRGCLPAPLGAFMRDVTVGQVKEAAVSIDFNYEEGDNDDFPPVAPSGVFGYNG